MLNLCTRSHFLFQNKVYQQIDGVQMGSPLGPTFANYFLGSVENNIFQKTKSFFPKFYVRYVDDVFAVFKKKGDVEEFLKVLNDQHPQLKFTVETTDSTLPFLDVEIKLTDGDVDTWVYRKKTDTKTILAFESLAPPSWKTGLWKCLLSRAEKICSNATLLAKEKDYLVSLFQRNGYTKSWLDKMLNNKDKDRDSITEDSNFILLKLPFLGSCSNKFSKALNRIFQARWNTTIKVAYSNYKIGKCFVLKDQLPWVYAANVVYEFKCTVDSDLSYIGMTTRQACLRMRDHFNPAKNSAIQNHVAQCNKCNSTKCYFNLFKIIKYCSGGKETEISEAFLIRKCQPRLNKQLGASGCSFTLNVFK